MRKSALLDGWANARVSVLLVAKAQGQLVQCVVLVLVERLQQHGGICDLGLNGSSWSPIVRCTDVSEDALGAIMVFL
jgi:hypothetical protein